MDYTFAVLCRSVFLGIKHGARAMHAGGHGGSIISTASVAGLSGGSGPHDYSAARAAVINLTRAAAIELAPRGIRVNAICPGVILTPLARRVDAPGIAERLDAAQPWPSHGTGDDIAATALFLASDESRFITGEAIVVDGGLTAGRAQHRGAARHRRQSTGRCHRRGVPRVDRSQGDRSTGVVMTGLRVDVMTGPAELPRVRDLAPRSAAR